VGTRLASCVMKAPNSATRLGAAVRPFAFAGATEKTIRVPAACACGSHVAMSASPGIVLGFDASQLIETRFTFSPTSFSVAKNDAPASPPDLPVSSVTPTSCDARHGERQQRAGAQQQTPPGTQAHPPRSRRGSLTDFHVLRHAGRGSLVRHDSIQQ